MPKAHPPSAGAPWPPVSGNVRSAHISFIQIDKQIKNNMEETIVAISMLMSGLLIALIGFGIIKLKAKKPEDDEQMISLRKKFGKFFKIGGIMILIIGAFLIIAPNSNNESSNWSQSQKEEMKKQVINSSNFLQRINSDTANLVATCFVEKYTEKFTLQESWAQDKMTQEQRLELIMPIMQECFEIYGIKTNK